MGRQLAGHVSQQMLQRYSHVRSAANVAAISVLEAGAKQAADGDVRVQVEAFLVGVPRAVVWNPRRVGVGTDAA